MIPRGRLTHEMVPGPQPGQETFALLEGDEIVEVDGSPFTE
jgi:hypothetical protein